jgi:hypothetical protein
VHALIFTVHCLLLDSNRQTPNIPSPLESLCRNEKKAHHSRGSGNPVAVIIEQFHILDASFRWHDELRHSLSMGGDRVRVKRPENTVPCLYQRGTPQIDYGLFLSSNPVSQDEQTTGQKG